MHLELGSPRCGPWTDIRSLPGRAADRSRGGAHLDLSVQGQSEDQRSPPTFAQLRRLTGVWPPPPRTKAACPGGGGERSRPQTRSGSFLPPTAARAPSGGGGAGWAGRTRASGPPPASSARMAPEHSGTGRSKGTLKLSSLSRPLPRSPASRAPRPRGRFGRPSQSLLLLAAPDGNHSSKPD